MLKNADQQGFPKGKLKAALEAHPGSRFGVEWAPEAKILAQGHTLTYGDYTFTCIETPGHTLGHICLYETAKKILISGDHVLIDISPNIQCCELGHNGRLLGRFPHRPAVVCNRRSIVPSKIS